MERIKIRDLLCICGM